MSEPQRPRLLVIVGSVRDGRVGASLAAWYAALARDSGLFEVEVADLRDGPGLFDEAVHPGQQRYQGEALRSWSATVARADAVVAVSPEYNYFLPAPLLNAFQSVYVEWGFMPLGMVTYGGISGGLRAAQTLRTIASDVLMMITETGVAVPLVAECIARTGEGEGDEGLVFTPPERAAADAPRQLEELAALAGALAGLRAERRTRMVHAR